MKVPQSLALFPARVCPIAGGRLYVVPCSIPAKFRISRLSLNLQSSVETETEQAIPWHPIPIPMH
jgi:hypothetical protein